MAASDARSIFESSLPKRLESHPDLVGKINAAFKFNISGDGGGTWVVDLTQPGGKITEGDGDAPCTIGMDAGDFVSMMNGELNPQMAFMGGKLKVEGDMAMALKLAALVE